VPREDDDFKARHRRRQKEDEADEQADAGAEVTGAGVPDTRKLEELIARAEPLIEQVNSLYMQYFAGTERKAPGERRLHLEQIMTSLLMMHKPTPAIRFRVGGIQSTYNQYRDRWDRMMRDVESGKLKRRGT
jgi:hypothetical protein